MASKTFILLGRLGDLINCLPIFFAESQTTGQPCRVMCCREYASLFEGTSYVQCIPFDGKDNELRRAYSEAKATGDEIVSLQVIGDTQVVKDITYGPAGFDKAQTDSFQKEPYWLTKNQEIWSRQPPPIFDRRNTARETELKFRYSQPGILVAANGKSSPFPYRELLFELLRGRSLRLIDLNQIKAERFYDFIGLLESARCLISVDSAFLHLAQACSNIPIPVCALVNDSPKLWFGSAWRYNHISHIRYSDFPLRAVEMLDAIEGIGSIGSYFKVQTGTGPRLIHVWSKYELHDESKARHQTAKSSWLPEYAEWPWIACPIEVGALGRDSNAHSIVKDDQRHPYVKDVIRLACYRARPDDIIILTRSDTCFSETLSMELMTGELPAYSYRTYRDETGDNWNPQVDLFAFTKKWWTKHQSDLPEFFLGSDQFWSRTLLHIVKSSGGREIQFGVYRSPSTAKIQGGRRYLWNEQCHNDFEAKHGQIALAKPCVEQLPAAIVNRHALDSYGYNGSIVRFGGKLLLAYRYHDDRNLSTALAIAQVDEKGNVYDKKSILLPQSGGSEEDPRLFAHNNELWLSYVDSTFPAMPPRAVVKYGRLIESSTWKLENVSQPNYGQNDMSACEKNWLLWSHAGKIVCIYSTSPKTVVIELQGPIAKIIAEYDGPRWPWGAIRGGATPILYKGSLLRFFHSAVDSEPPPNRRRYFVGAMLMDGQPPFKPIAISKRPIIWGSELDTLSAVERSGCLQHKVKVIFPLGAVEASSGKWILSAGINDSHCGLFTITEKDLNFT